MSRWYEVFDNEQVQWLTRTQATRLILVAALTIAWTLVAMSLQHEGHLPTLLAGALVAGAWGLSLWWILSRFQHLRRVMWCIKISDRRVVGYDFRRQKTTVDWTNVQCIELRPHGLRLVGLDGVLLEIPHLYPDFAALSHRIVYYAEFYHLPILIEGQPWEEVDVFAVYPFLADLSTPEPPDASWGA